MKNKLRALVARCTPDAIKVAGVFLVTFAVTAAPFVPALVAEVNAGKSPSFSSLHAVVAASFAAALRATVPVLRVLGVKAAYKIVAYVEKNKKVEAVINADPAALKAIEAAVATAVSPVPPVA